MEFIGKLDESVSLTGTFKYNSGCRPTCSLKRLEITDEHIGPLPANFAGLPDVTLSATQMERWQMQHLFLLSILRRNSGYEIYIDASWTQQAENRDEEIPLKSWFRDLWDVNFYIGMLYVPMTFGMVKVPHSEGTSGKHYDHKYEVFSPYIRNNRYNGGEMYFHNASRNMEKALKIVHQRTRAPLPEERHLPEIKDVLNHQEKAMQARKDVAHRYARQVASYDNQDAVLKELVAMREHVIRHEHIGGAKMSPYVFLSKELTDLLDSYVAENVELGEAIDDALENSKCLQRVHIIKGDNSGRRYFSRTVIRIRDMYPTQHDVYGDTSDAAYRPVESMPEDVAAKIATLDLLDKEWSTSTHNNNWMLNVGVIVNKGELYYLPITAEELVESPGVI